MHMWLHTLFKPHKNGEDEIYKWKLYTLASEKWKFQVDAAT